MDNIKQTKLNIFRKKTNYH